MNYNQFKLEHCVACGSSDQLDVAHIHTQKAWPEYKYHPKNCCTLCRMCHIKQGSAGIWRFSMKYPNYKKWLVDNKWYVCTLTGKWRNEFKD